MSGNFSFPPPPPPPAKAAAVWHQDQTCQAGFPARGSRSRGTPSSHRGRGDETRRGRGNGNSNYGSHLGGLPPGAFVNPNFNGHLTAEASGYPPRTAAGHKRKLETLRELQQGRGLPSPPIAPAVPSFNNTALPPPRISAAPSSEAFRLNQIGKDHDSSSEEENDVDEEAMSAELGDKLTFEHNGTVLVLHTSADIVAWQRERRKNWPTQTRMAEKNAEKRVIGVERRRLLSGAAMLHAPGAGLSERRRRIEIKAEPPPPIPESKLQAARRHLAEQTASLEALRQKVAGSQARIERCKAKQQADEESLAERLAQSILPEEGGDEADLPSESSVVSSASEDDSDGPPEEIQLERPNRGGDGMSVPSCRYFTASGSCRDGDACRFRHDPSQQAALQLQPRPAPRARPTMSTSQRKGIFQRLAEHEQEENDRLVLKVTKHLGKAGFFC